MSSSSDTDSEASEFPPRTESLTQPGQDGRENARVRNAASNMNPYLVSDDQTWLQREGLGHSAAVPSSSTSSRVLPPGRMEPSRYGSIPFSMADMPVEARRQSLMAMDRKRRLTGPTHDNGSRRRNLAGGFNERHDSPNARAPDTFASSSRSPVAYHRQHFGPGPSTEVIDLTNSPPQVAMSSPSLTRQSSGSTSGIYVVPRWQPDSEVSECPICRRPFSFLFRRHHCRKCGRVVCNDCSPHRITIPRQFIVNPPGPTSYTVGAGRDTVDLTGEGEDEDEEESHATPYGSSRHHRHLHSAGIGGGEKVRLCNPCVPDPQPEPQPNFATSTLPSSPAPGRRDDLLTLSDALRSSRHDLHNNSTEPFPGFLSSHSLLQNGQSSRARPLPLPPQPRSGSDFDHIRFAGLDRYNQLSHVPFSNPPVLHHRHHSSDVSHTTQPQQGNRPRIRSMLDESYLPRMFSGYAPATRPRLNEEDICPVCRRALPPRGPGGDESAREAHIMECINLRGPSSQAGTRGLGGSMPLLRGPMHMLPFVATEKDCVGEDGNVPECSICMVEYDVGDELARLECLCKFHRECISEWFTRKQECPVHKIT